MGGGSSAPATGDVLADAWRELHKANVFLANAHHTSRTVPHNGDLAGAIQNARVAEELILRHAKLSSADKLLIYGRIVL